LLNLAFQDTQKESILKCIFDHLKERLSFNENQKELQPKSTSTGRQKSFNLKQAISYLLPFAHNSLISHAILSLEKNLSVTPHMSDSFKKCFTAITNDSDIQESLSYIVIILKECFDKVADIKNYDS
jgi:hypothetical protein